MRSNGMKNEVNREKREKSFVSMFQMKEQEKGKESENICERRRFVMNVIHQRDDDADSVVSQV